MRCCCAPRSPRSATTTPTPRHWPPTCPNDSPKRARNDETHLREQARYLLEVGLDPRAALALAQRNFAVQKEPADARILLESAFAAGDVDAAKPALDWIAKTRIDALALVALSGKLVRRGKK
jgi:hypothetical protein